MLLIPVVKYDWMAKTSGERVWYYLCLVVLILLSGLRYRVGGDTMTYMALFEEIPSLSEYKNFDFFEAAYQPLWYLLNMFSKSINESFTCFQLIHAAILNVSFFHFFRKYCPNYYFTAILLYFLTYFCYFNMEVLRESLCISLLLWAVPSLLQKKWLTYYSFCIVGVFVHYSSMIMFVIPLLFWLLKKPNVRLQLIILVSVFVIVSLVNVVDVMLKLLPISQQFVELLNRYIETQRTIGGIISQLLYYIPVFGLIYLHGLNEKEIKFPLLPIILGFVIINTMAMNLGAFERLVNYFKPFVLIYLVHIAYSIISSKRIIEYQKTYCILFVVLVVFCFNSVRYYTKDMSDYYPNSKFFNIYTPYHSVFNPIVDERRERMRENLLFDVYL